MSLTLIEAVRKHLFASPLVLFPPLGGVQWSPGIGPVPRPNPRWPIYIIHSIDNIKSSNPRESPRYLEVLKDKTDSSLQMKVCRLLNRALNTKSYLSALYVRSIMIPSEASSSLSRALGSVLRNVSWKLYKMQRKISFYIMLITFREKCLLILTSRYKLGLSIKWIIGNNFRVRSSKHKGILNDVNIFHESYHDASRSHKKIRRSQPALSWKTKKRYKINWTVTVLKCISSYFISTLACFRRSVDKTKRESKTAP